MTLRRTPRFLAAFTLAAAALTSPGPAAADDAGGDSPAAPPVAPASTSTSAGVATGVRTTPFDDAAYDAALQRALGVETQLVGALAKVRQSSVSVLMYAKPQQPGGPQAIAGCGSGVLVSFGSRLWVISNHHVAGAVDKVEVVTLDGRKFPAELVDAVKVYDFALLRLTGKTPGLKGAPILPRASRELEEGQWVLATGNPFFLAVDGASVATLGVISGLDRQLGGQYSYAGAIQHDAAVNPGNSGGPLWNLKGELIGINGMIASRGGGGVGASNTGASFSIPIDQIQPYLQRMADAKQDAQAGFLGLAVETSTDARGTPNGACVTGVDPKSPARTGGDPVFVGDVIVSISAGGKVVPVQTANDLTSALTVLPAGTQVRLRLRRNGREVAWSGKLGSQS